MCNLDVRIREREGEVFFFFARVCTATASERRTFAAAPTAFEYADRSEVTVLLFLLIQGFYSFYNASCALVCAVSARRGRVPPHSPQVLPSVVEGVSSPLQFPTQHLQPSLGRGVERRRRVRPRARAGRADARERRVSAGVVVLTAGREEHGPRDVCFPPDARWGEDVGVARRERALQPTHRLLEVAAHGVHELAAHDVASPNRLDARRRAESRLHRGARARRLCVDAVWGSDFLNARLSDRC